jgi:hypothetical protein
MNIANAFREAEFQERKKKGLVCEGLLFKGYSSEYCNDGEIGRREGFRLLKRKSCKGYPDCKSYDGEDISTHHCDHWFLEEMSDMLDCECVMMPPIEDQELYRVRVINETTDWESGHVDGYDFEFYKVEKDDGK